MTPRALLAPAAFALLLLIDLVETMLDLIAVPTVALMREPLAKLPLLTRKLLAGLAAPLVVAFLMPLLRPARRGWRKGRRHKKSAELSSAH